MSVYTSTRIQSNVKTCSKFFLASQWMKKSLSLCLCLLFSAITWWKCGSSAAYCSTVFAIAARKLCQIAYRRFIRGFLFWFFLLKNISLQLVNEDCESKSKKWDWQKRWAGRCPRTTKKNNNCTLFPLSHQTGVRRHRGYKKTRSGNSWCVRECIQRDGMLPVVGFYTERYTFPKTSRYIIEM